MANLMGLLLSASPAKVLAMSRFWHIDADTEPRALVSQLYDHMTEEYTVKSVLERLSPSTKLVLDRLITVPKGWLPIEELASSLPFSEEDTQQILADLEQAGMVAVEIVRVFRNDILEGPAYTIRGHPAVQTTVARVPQDLLRVLQRIKQQMSEGDKSEKRLHKLLGELDLPQLHLLCERWHVSDTHQRFKKELMVLLENKMGQAHQVNEALARLGCDAQAVFRAVQAAGNRIPLKELRQSLGLDERSLKRAISSLASLFLVQETYIANERYIFIPIGVALHDDISPLSSETDSPSEVSEPSRISSIDYSFYYDLLALLNYFEQHRVELTVIERRIPRRVISELREQLTIGGKNGRRASRLDYLFHVARELKLLETKDGRVWANPKVKEWAAKGIVGQAEELLRLWLDDNIWKGPNPILLAGPGDAFCIAMRRTLLARLKQCQPGKWHSLGSLVACIANDLGVNDGCARSDSPSFDKARANWPNRAEVHDQTVSVIHLFQWLALLSLGANNGDSVTAFQLTPLGAWVFGCEGAVRPESREATFTVGHNFEVLVAEPDTSAWYHLLKFSLTVSVGRASVHQITKRKVQQAVYWGFSAEDILEFLSARNNHRIPANVANSIEEWAKSIKIVSLERLTVLEVDTQAVLDELMACPKYSRWLGRRISPTAVVVQDTLEIKRLMKEMRSDGYFPRLDY